MYCTSLTRKYFYALIKISKYSIFFHGILLKETTSQDLLHPFFVDQVSESYELPQLEAVWDKKLIKCYRDNMITVS
jgi:hypothetical protein